MISIRSPQDFGAAIVIAVIGLGGLWFGRDLHVGSVSQMGPGYLPMVLSYGLLIFAVIIGLRGLTIQGPPVEAIVLRAVLLVLGAILLFALLLERIGLPVTAIIVTLVAAFGSREAKWTEASAVAIVLAVFSVGIFIYALRQPLPLFWGG